MNEQKLKILASSTVRSVSFNNGDERNISSEKLSHSLVEGEKYFGTFSWPSGAEYTGEFCSGKRNGCGKQTWPEGSSYEGEFVDDMRHGFGTQLCTSGEVNILTFLNVLF